MKKIIPLLLSSAAILVVSSCGQSENSTAPVSKEPVSEASKELVVDPTYLRYDIGDPLKNKTVGFGAEIEPDTFFALSGNDYYDYENGRIDEEKAILLENRIKEMNLQFTRIRMGAAFYEFENDNDDPDVWDPNSEGVNMNSLEMQSILRILDICERNNVKVDISFQGCPILNWTSLDGKYTAPHWLSCADYWTAHGVTFTEWASAPYDAKENAEAIYAFLDYVINQKGYTCIYGVSNISEGAVGPDHSVNWEYCCEMIREIDKKLTKEGLRDKVKLISHDLAGAPALSYQLEEPIKDNLDVFSLATYAWDNKAPQESLDNTFTDFYDVAEELGINDYGMYISEFCEGLHFTDAVRKTDIDDYEAALYVARFLISASTHGFTAINHYILNDVWFSNQYYHTMGLWMGEFNHVDFDIDTTGFVPFACHPEYYTYGLITKYTDSGSTVYRPEQVGLGEYESPNPDISIGAYKLPDGSWTYAIVNNGTSQRKVAVVNPEISSKETLNLYKLSASDIPENRDAILPEARGTIEVVDGVAYIKCPAKSVTIVSNKGMN